MFTIRSPIEFLAVLLGVSNVIVNVATDSFDVEGGIEISCPNVPTLIVELINLSNGLWALPVLPELEGYSQISCAANYTLLIRILTEPGKTSASILVN